MSSVEDMGAPGSRRGGSDGGAGGAGGAGSGGGAPVEAGYQVVLDQAADGLAVGGVGRRAGRAEVGQHDAGAPLPHDLGLLLVEESAEVLTTHGGGPGEKR